jgi:hypothetical protein
MSAPDGERNNMSNDNQAALDLFNNQAELALTEDELLSIHGGATNSGGGQDSSSSHHSSHHDSGGGGGHHDSGGGGFGAPVPPAVMQLGHGLQQGAEAVRDGAAWLVEQAADALIGTIDRSGLTNTPILIDHVVPPKPQA